MRTTIERWFDAILIASAALTPWILGRRPAFWEGLLFATVVTCLVLGIHIITATVQVFKGVNAHPLGHLVESPLYYPNNKKESVLVPDPRPSHFRLKLMLIALLSLGLLALVPVAIKRYTPLALTEEPSPPRPSTQSTASVELEIVPTLEKHRDCFRIDIDMTGAGTLAARKLAVYPRYWVASTTTGERPTTEQVDRRFRAFEDETKYKSLGANDLGIKGRLNARQETGVLDSKEINAIEHGTQWLYIFVIVKYSDDLHPELWSKGCMVYSKGILETCLGHNEAPL